METINQLLARSKVFYNWFYSRLLWFACGAIIFTLAYSDTQVHLAPITVVEVVQAAEIEATPILDKIAVCESGNTHFDPKTGQVLTMGNQNKTVDIGRYQINEFYWGKKASSLGFDLFDEADNEAMAKWMLANYGTEPWVHSKACWNK